MLWRHTLESHFAGVISVDEFFATYLPNKGGADTGRITRLVNSSASAWTAAVSAVNAANREGDMSSSFIEYLTAIVSSFPDSTRPSFDDTHLKHFPPIQPEDHHTSPDITSTRPGRPVPAAWSWSLAGTVFELKFRTDIFKGDAINDSLESVAALIQLAKSARSLLASGFCFVNVVAVFRTQARILRFDHTGFRSTHAFDWTTDNRTLPQFLRRLYSPNRIGRGQYRMYGEDTTASIPTKGEKELMYKRWKTTGSYTALTSKEDAPDLSFDTATRDSRWVTAKRGDAEVKCFTIGPPIHLSDGLFSRATRVDRVILKDDASNTVYALKDAWRQACRRPEADFYDLIHKWCEENEDKVDPTEVAQMAKCHGTLELSVKSNHHKTNSTSSQNFELERSHSRVLLTPVGTSITKFWSSKELLQGLHGAVKQHSYAHAAGVIHRDISEGNIMFDELTRQGFLVDWDYAEFTGDGLANFTKWFPERANANRYPDVDKSLKELTGTFPFLAIALLKQPTNHRASHDLESIYWLLVWIILRHTAHTNTLQSRACHELFDQIPDTAAQQKVAWLSGETPLAKELPLFLVTEALREKVAAQNPRRAATKNPFITVTSPPPQAVELLHRDFVDLFEQALKIAWPEDDKAIVFEIPHKSDTPMKAAARASKAGSSLLRQVVSGSQGRGGLRTGSSGPKRQREPEMASTSTPTESGSSTGADIDGSTASKKRARTAGVAEPAVRAPRTKGKGKSKA
ncbi:hypothetical protein C8R43DRAFT_238851 [Mycena crocata]|nr:hypothetical protein C8R43DRAFT_238851 [Mycena crocata]